MKERFAGQDGERRLKDAVKDQALVHGDARVAEALADAGEVCEYSLSSCWCQKHGDEYCEAILQLDD